MAAAFQITPTEEKANRLRLLVLTFECGTKVLKHIFDKFVPPCDLNEILRKNKTKLKRNKHISNQQLIKLYSQQREPSSEDFDITMLTILLQNICNADVDENSKWWSPESVPPSFESSLEADISRLRHWRNKMCHPTTFCLKEEDFEREWKNTEEVLKRLGVDIPNLQQEIQSLKEETIDPRTEKVYEDRIIELTVELASTKEGNACLKEKDSAKHEMSSELLSLISMSKLHFEDFDQHHYVITETYKRAKAKFDGSGCLIISGLPGEGKTSMALKLIAETDEGDVCLKLRDKMDWKHVNLQKKYIVFIDDIFGAGELEDSLLNEWETVLPEIEKAVQNKKIKLVITSRQYIMAEAKKLLHRLKILDDKYVVEISSGDLSLEEKKEILQEQLRNSHKHLDESELERCIITYNVAFSRLQLQFRGHYIDSYKVPIMIGFPEIVSLFGKKDQLFCKGAAFFEKPVIFFKSCMEDLFRKQKHFLPLVVIWAKHRKGLKFTEIEPSNLSSEVTEIAKLFGFKLEGQTNHLFRKALTHHKGGFLRYSPETGIYTFCHNIVKDMVGLVIGQEYPDEVLQLANEQFVLQYVTTDEKCNDGLHVFIEQCRFEQLNRTMCKLFRTKEEHLLDLNYLDFFRQCVSHRNTQTFKINKINANIVSHDCFENDLFLKTFVNSDEGKSILHEPVSVITGRFCQYGIHFFEQDIRLYLPSFALLFDNTNVFNIFLKDMFTCEIQNKDEFLNISLLIAVHKGNTYAVEMILDRGAKISDDSIYIASVNNNIDILTILLDRRDLNDSISSNIINKNTPLIASVKRGHVASVKCLVEHGVDVNYRNSKDVSALDKAIIYNHPEVCSILLENGANVNASGRRYKRKPLHIAANIGNLENISLLLQHGATIDAKDYRGHFPVHSAAIRGNIKAVDCLLQEDFSLSSYRLKSYGKKSKIKGMDLMHIAVWKNNHSLIDLLLRSDVNPNVADTFGRTPLYCAAYDGKLDIVKKLVCVSDVNKAEKNGFTPLHAAVYKGHTEIAKIVSLFANVNAKDEYGKTPLHTACEQLNFRMFKFLCNDQNVDVRMCTKKGMTIFDTLIKADNNINLQVSKFLNSSGGNCDEEYDIETYFYEVYQKDFKFVLKCFTSIEKRQSILFGRHEQSENSLNATYPPAWHKIQIRRLST